MSRPAVKRGVGLLVVVSLALAGCGLPSRTDPKYLGAATAATPAADEAKIPLLPSDAPNAAELVRAFLQTSVGGNGPDEALTETQSRMRAFMTPEMKAKWRPGKQLAVVRDTYDEPEPLGHGDWSVTAHFLQIGTLNDKGELMPTLGQMPIDPTFQVKTTNNGTYLLSDVPQDQMLISASRLSDWYTEQPLYFWEAGVDIPKLVPDLRYIPKTLPKAKLVAEVLRLLKVGPTWLSPVAGGLPPDFDTKDNPIISADGVMVNLGTKAAGHNEDELRRLASQIRWSLPDHPPVSLEIDGQAQKADSANYDEDNVTLGQAESDPDRFCIVGGTVRSVVGTPPALFAPDGFNSSVVEAALNRFKNQAALVRRQSPNVQQLYISAADTTAAGPPKYVEVPGVSAARLSRPVWISRPVPRLLIAYGSKLYAITPSANGDGTSTVEPVSTGSQSTAGLTAFAVPPDGRRIALVIDGAVMVAPLQYDNGKLVIGAYRQLGTTLGDNQAVGWITETTLAVGGKPHAGLPTGKSYSLVSITIDGTEETPLPAAAPTATSNYEITEMAVRTISPLGAQGAVFIMFESNGIAHAVYSGEIRPIPIGDTQPSPSTSPTLDKTGPQIPRAPFYTD